MQFGFLSFPEKWKQKDLAVSAKGKAGNGFEVTFRIIFKL